MTSTGESPSNCTYCYQLECSINIVPSSSSVNKGSIVSKKSIVTVGRNPQRQIVLQIELCNARSGQQTVVSYELKSSVIHQQSVAQGKSSIEIPSRGIILQLSNCAPRKLNVFMKSLQAKLDILKAESGPDKTPINKSNASTQLPKVFNVLSPLSISEIRKVRQMRGVSTGKSPLAKGVKVQSSPISSRNPTETKTSTTPISSARERRLNVSSLGLQRMRSFARFDDEEKVGFAPLSTIPEEGNHSSKNNSRIELTVEQKRVIREVVQERRNVFFTGSAGTGKSVILQRIIEMLPASSTFITAATGVAACHIGGVTLHSFAGIGVGDGSEEACRQRVLANKGLVKQWKQCAHLIIDEISMIDKSYFTKLEFVARAMKNNDEPFGGIQLIITGDFLQLPPVSKEEPEFCFESEAWMRSVHRTIVLKTVKRQDDKSFVDILNNIRHGRCDPKSATILASTSKHTFPIEIQPTRLCTHTADADKINLHSLKNLKEEPKFFTAHDDGYVPESVQSMVNRRIELKIGSQVMLLKNIDLSRGLSNGSRGRVQAFSANGNPLVKFAFKNQTVEIRRSKFSIRIPGCEPVTRTQVPLALAWAISIHKSQGLTLDCVEMSLERTFADGQAYVALSRARALSSIRIIGFHSSCVRANSKVIEYYKSLVNDDCYEEDDCQNSPPRKKIRTDL